ncbi:hypothetical protein ASPBRDRAFT_454360 [Aspergillus brasiliensis CBS 101740]|uniref:Uncharacterized protein n=1 Tax=Aspergillus brasiliensis (strain CBS 101740 / IMI 381727 / IBT 21946) TaxID=767769 RepID=A0A1L9USI1_ASPBC|nr:hypothetical protein ASPBRDRAFT_454360 [Aspergillus brasiliensis CBS 101740]
MLISQGNFSSYNVRSVLAGQGAVPWSLKLSPRERAQATDLVRCTACSNLLLPAPRTLVAALRRLVNAPVLSDDNALASSSGIIPYNSRQEAVQCPHSYTQRWALQDWIIGSLSTSTNQGGGGVIYHIVLCYCCRCVTWSKEPVAYHSDF